MRISAVGPSRGCGTRALLQLIREVIPAPTVHARNLFHTSAAMWDAWAAYDPDADGYFVTEKQTADDVTAAREAAISYAAYRLLLWRYGTVSDLATAPDELDAVMASLCYRTDYESTDGDDPAALGNRIAEAVITYGSTDGALEDDRYVDSSYQPANDPMVVADPGAVMTRSERVAAALARRADRAERPADPRQGPDVHRSAVGVRDPVRARAVAHRHADRPGPAAAARRPGDRRRLQAGGARGHPVQLRTRPGRRCRGGDLAGRARRQHARDERRKRARREPGDRRAVRTHDRAAGRLPAGGRGVLGRRTEVGDAAGSLEPDRQRGVGRARLRAADRRRRSGRRSARMGRQDVLRAERRRPRRGDRGVGSEGLLRLGATDLDDPVHGRQGSVERPGRDGRTTPRACRWNPGWSR